MRVLYEINVRPWLSTMSARAGTRLTLADVPDAELDALAGHGIDLVWMMGVWRTGAKAREIALTHEGLLHDYGVALPDFTPADVAGSPYSIAAYEVSEELGGAKALAVLRRRLARRGIRVILDFVVNHTGIDHRWVTERPDLYIHGHEGDADVFRAGSVLLAHGKDPYYPSWTDTAQLDLAKPATRAELRAVMASIASQCDGLRCDMAMLALQDIFAETWHRRPDSGELWPELIAAARGVDPSFLFIAEVYWGRESEVRAVGFDFVYDKTLYERLLAGDAAGVRRHLEADPALQRRSVRFLENHDERRIAAVLPFDRHRAAAILVGFVPGLMLLYEGQIEGRRTRLPVQLRREADAPRDPEIADFYGRLLAVLRDPLFRRGDWRLCAIRPAWEGNASWEHCLVFEWTLDSRRAWIAVNFGPDRSQCFASVDAAEIPGDRVELRDLLGGPSYLRDRDAMNDGLYVDLPGFGTHVFEVIVLG